MKELISRITMKKTKVVGFVDIVSGEIVSHWIDCYRDEYLAVNRFGNRIKKLKDN